MRKKAPTTIEEIKRELRLEEKSLRNLRRYAAKTAEEKLMLEPARRKLLDLRWQVRVKELELAERELRRAKRALREVEKAPKCIVDVDKKTVLIRGKWRPGLVTEEVDLLIVKALGMTPGNLFDTTFNGRRLRLARRLRGFSVLPACPPEHDDPVARPLVLV